MKVKVLDRLTEQEVREVVVMSKLTKEDTSLKPFTSLKFGEVLELKGLARNGVDDVLIVKVLELNKRKTKLENRTLKAFFAIVNFIKNQFKYLGELEQKLDTETENDLIVAGIDELNKFGDLNTIDALAGGDILRWQQVLDLTYEDVYNKLLKTKTEEDIKKRLETIYKSKHNG